MEVKGVRAAFVAGTLAVLINSRAFGIKEYEPKLGTWS